MSPHGLLKWVYFCSISVIARFNLPNRNKIRTQFFAVGVLVSLFLVSPGSLARPQCVELFSIQQTSLEELSRDPRSEWNQKNINGLLKIGEGNSADVYLFKDTQSSYSIVKIYRADQLEKLERDHKGLQEVQRLFDLDSLHSLNFRVVKSQIVKNFNGKAGQDVLIAPFVPGLNLHQLLVNTNAKNPLHQQAVELYNRFVQELDRVAIRLGIRDEIREESEIYFQDHIVDGLPMLIIEGRPRILIKSDNLIFNPVDNSLTLIDPF
jgi:hypothetical protein